jgi:conjugal transfer/type IV secretion protein DotA/TraY
VSLGILQHIFGPIIDLLVRGGDPNTVSASSNLLASMLSYYNMGILAVASLIISYVATVGTINTANDGEAMGKQWSSVWTPLRIVTGGAVLLPTASGYSFLQMFVLTLSLWGVGFANQLYRVGMTMGIIKTDNIVTSSTAVPASAFGLRSFAKQYLPISYCAHVSNAVYADEMGSPNVQANGQADRISTVDGRVDYTFFVKDRNPATNVGGGEPFCGTVKLSSYTSGGTAEAGTSASISMLHSGLSNVKIQAATALMADINAWVATMPVDINQTGWVIESKKFNDIVKLREDALATQITAQVSTGTMDINSGISTFINTLTRDGWAMAGGWYQRSGAIRKELGSAITESVGNASEPSLSALPDDARARLLQSSVSTVVEAIIKKSEEPGKGYDVTAAPAADISNSLPKNGNGDMNIGAIQQDINTKFGSIVNSTMKTTVDIATGSSADIDAVSRMKLVGDYLVISMATAEVAKSALQTTVAAVRATVAGVGGVQVLGTKVDGSGSMTALWDWLLAAPIKQMDKLISYLEPLAFYFSVFLPSLPYAIFMITVVGWVLGVLQTVIAAPLWAVMHMRPSQTFVGSDAQGYLLLLAMFVRPALAIIGLFASMLLADPIVDYIAQAFFSMRGAVVTSTGLFPGALVEFVTFAWWMFAFGLTLLPVLYMIYGLPQVLPDHVLKWINAGVHDLGATHAMSGVRGGLAMSLLQAKNKDESSGRSKGGAPSLPPLDPAGGGYGGGRHEPLSAGEQGVAPLSAGNAAVPSRSRTMARSSSDSFPTSDGEEGAVPLNSGDVAISPSMVSSDDAAVSLSMMSSGDAAISSAMMSSGDAAISRSMVSSDDAAVSSSMMSSSGAAVSSSMMSSSGAAVSSSMISSGDAAIPSSEEILKNSREVNAKNSATRNDLPPPPAIMVEL